MALMLLLGLGCAGVAPQLSSREPLRISEILEQGDPARRASLGLVERGLEADGSAQPDVAREHYQTALRVDPTNPFAYLALSRHFVERGDPARGLEHLSQAEVLLAAPPRELPRLEAHLLGLRGAALRAAGRPFDADPLLERAARLAPAVWSDGTLSAEELQ